MRLADEPPGRMNAFYHRLGLYNARPIAVRADADRLARPLLLRSTDLHSLNDEGRRFFQDIGLRTIVDLRDRAEREARPNVVEGVGADVMAAPLFDGLRERGHGADLDRIFGARDTAQVYAYMVRHCGPEIAAVAVRVAEPEGQPAVIHCVGGKDRTGVVVAVLLAAAGVPEEAIIEDYLLTAELEGSEWFRTFDVASIYGQVQGGPFLDRRWIEAALEELRAGHGNGEAYLLRHGVGPQTIAALRATILVG